MYMDVNLLFEHLAAEKKKKWIYIIYLFVCFPTNILTLCFPEFGNWGKFCCDSGKYSASYGQPANGMDAVLPLQHGGAHGPADGARCLAAVWTCGPNNPRPGNIQVRWAGWTPVKSGVFGCISDVQCLWQRSCSSHATAARCSAGSESVERLVL